MGENAGNSEEPFVPKTRNDWSEMFRDGLKMFQAERDEEEAKNKAGEGGTGAGGNSGGNGDGGTGNGGTGSNDGNRKRTLGDLLLGNK